jgi:hypothetical protein
MATKKPAYKKGGPVKRQIGGPIPPMAMPPPAPARRAPAKKVASKKAASKSKSKSRARGKLPTMGGGLTGLGGTGAQGMMP